ILPKRKTAPGQSALGVSVLSLKGKIGGLSEEETDLRLDSGADITLLSADCYHNLRKPPPLKNGVKLKLWQLTDRDTSLEGYVHIPVFVSSPTAGTVGMMAEAYVVPGMSVPILLGEDFQRTYELTVTRKVELGTTVTLGDSGVTVKAEGIQRPSDAGRIRKSAANEASFVRRKPARYSSRRTRRYHPTVYGDWQESGEWFVEKQLIGSVAAPHLAIPNMLLSSASVTVPVSNLMSQPRIVKKGSSLATVEDARTELDVAGDEEQQMRMEDAAGRTAALL
ncbi:hypothetical protein BC835DRAFT_1252496, partial [Cytidiella melzeri]